MLEDKAELYLLKLYFGKFEKVKKVKHGFFFCFVFELKHHWFSV